MEKGKARMPLKEKKEVERRLKELVRLGKKELARRGISSFMDLRSIGQCALAINRVEDLGLLIALGAMDSSCAVANIRLEHTENTIYILKGLAEDFFAPGEHEERAVKYFKKHGKRFLGWARGEKLETCVWLKDCFILISGICAFKVGARDVAQLMLDIFITPLDEEMLSAI